MTNWSDTGTPKLARTKCRHCGKEFDINPLLFHPMDKYPCPRCKRENDVLGKDYYDWSASKFTHEEGK